MKYSLVAVSGGSDSMALLDILRKKGKKLVVCHVNYGLRKSALRDEGIVKKYCNNYNIKVEVLNNANYSKEEGNFENWARIIRYNFFKETYNKYNCDFLYVGHNLDDLLETYYIQKNRKSKCDYYGIKEESVLYDMIVKRILLGYSKEYLKNYCLENEIEFGVDETNFDTSYLRNKIRRNVIANMNEPEKKKQLLEINKLNIQKNIEYERLHKLLKESKSGNNSIDLKFFRDIKDKDKISVLYYLIIECVKEKVSAGKKRLLDIIKKINSNKANIVLGEFKDFVLYKEYEKLVMKKKNIEYKYVVKDLNCDIEKFVIAKEGTELEKIEVVEELFPLVIENYNGENKIINRLFIERKIPISQRKSWPIIKDKLGRVLLVLNIKKFYNNMDSSSDKIIKFYIRRKVEEKA